MFLFLKIFLPVVPISYIGFRVGKYGNCIIFKIKQNFVILELIGQPHFDLK